MYDACPYTPLCVMLVMRVFMHAMPFKVVHYGIKGIVLGQVSLNYTMHSNHGIPNLGGGSVLKS